MKENTQTVNEVIGFINTFKKHFENAFVKEVNDAIAESVEHHFRSGYCWHLAIILRETFGRGKVCWAAPFGHIVWVDEDDLAYDIEGLYTGEAFYFIPIEYLQKHGHTDEGFKHISDERDIRYGDVSAEHLIMIMKDFCAETNTEYNTDAEKYLKNHER